MSLIDINDIDKDELLYELWNNSTIIFKNMSFNLITAKKEMKENYPDYVCGRSIKLDIYNSNLIDPFLYDRDNGNNKVSQIVQDIKDNIKHKKMNFTKFKNILAKSSQTNSDKEEEILKEAFELYNSIF
jgi:hypothetical protein